MTQSSPPIEKLQASTYTVPTDSPESDGTIEWSSTTVVVAQVWAGGKCGLGYTYTDAAAASLIREKLSPLVCGSRAFDVPAISRAMARATRNLGRPGLAACAISAVDTALWDLKARILDVPLVELLGKAHDSVVIYGSGGFTSYELARLQEQLGGWAAGGISRVKMKVGREPARDRERVAAARDAVGDGVALMVDANGAYPRKQALAMAEHFVELGVDWFEEPVSSDDLEGLRFLRDRGPGGLDIAAGEYGYDPYYFHHMLGAGAVDVLQADATRCLGVTGFMVAARLCEAQGVPLSAHCAPALHLPLCCASLPTVHLEYFHDHVRIEHILFDGAVHPHQGRLTPDLGREGLGLVLKEADAKRFAA